MNFHEYSISNLGKVCSNESVSGAELQEKNSFIYLDKYLEEKSCKSICVEDSYVSKDYLDNYQHYYSSCFINYPKKCKRIHFFSFKFEEGGLTIDSYGKLENALSTGYLGFAVVRPVSPAVIGFTLLKNYQDDNFRLFWGNRKYQVNLLGFKHSFYSLAFQEQDTVISACATTSIWSILSKSHVLHGTRLKAPHKITREAGLQTSTGTRIIPNKGLEIGQICNVLHKSGVEAIVYKGESHASESFSFKVDGDKATLNLGEFNEGISKTSKIIDSDFLRNIINCYALLGLPMIAVVKPYKDAKALHSMAINGFKKSIGKTTATSLKKDPSGKEIIEYGYQFIETIYAHDDQWGPYTRININKINSKAQKIEISTIWTDPKFTGDKENEQTRVVSLIVPIYHKVRVDYKDFRRVVGVFRHVAETFESVTKRDVLIDYYLQNSNDYKKELSDRTDISLDKKIVVLQKSLPKYIWVLRTFANFEIIYEHLFDATDLSLNMLGLNFIETNVLQECTHLFEHIVASDIRRFQNLFKEYKVNSKYLNFMLNRKSVYLVLAENIVKRQLSEKEYVSISENGKEYPDDFESGESSTVVGDSFFQSLADFDWPTILNAVKLVWNMIESYRGQNKSQGASKLTEGQKDEIRTAWNSKVDKLSLTDEKKADIKEEVELLIKSLDK